MKQSFEEESFTQWWCLGRPYVGTITSSRVLTPESPGEVVRSDDETQHGIDREERDVGNAGMLWRNQVRNLGVRMGDEIDHGFPYDDLSCNLDCFLMAETAMFVSAPNRLLSFNVGCISQSNELMRMILSLDTEDGTHTHNTLFRNTTKYDDNHYDRPEVRIDRHR
jgi:hypothetical protein